MKRVLLSLGLVVACAGGPPPGEGVTALTGATAIDVVAGRIIPDAVVLIRDGHVEALGMRGTLPVPRGATEVELTGRWIIPGLIDADTRLAPWGLAASLKWGVTTVRGLGAGPVPEGSPGSTVPRVPAPRRFAAVWPLTASFDEPGADAWPISDSLTIIAALDSNRAAGATWVMVSADMPTALFDQVVQRARAARLPVAAIAGATDARMAARLGVTSLERLGGVMAALDPSGELSRLHRVGRWRGWTAAELAWVWADTMALGRLAEDLAATGVTLVPTLGVHAALADLDDSSAAHRVALAGVPDSAIAAWDIAGLITRAGWTASEFADFRLALPRQQWFVARFAAAGGRVVAGSGSSGPRRAPGADLHGELELLVAAGLTPLDALRAATSSAAALLGADSLGSIRPGAVADLVVLTADPLADIRTTRRIERVMLGGAWVYPGPRVGRGVSSL